MPSTRILGLDFAVDKSALGPTGQKRKDTAQKILSRLQVLPMTRGFKEFLSRTRCQTIISWGCWMQGHDPEFDRSWIMQLKRSMASRALWTLLQGHWVSSTLTADIACVSHYIRSVNFWHTRNVFIQRGTWVSHVRKIMQKAGFAHISFGHFRHPIWGDSRFCMTQWKQTFKTLAHQLREVWRRALFNSFLSHSRRDSRSLNAAGVRYNEQQVTLTRKIYFSASSDERARCARKSKLGKSQIIAPGAMATTAAWDHVWWECPCFCSGRPTRPHDPLADRLGWSIGSNSEAKHLIHYMAEVRNRILAGIGSVRISFADTGPAVLEAQCPE